MLQDELSALSLELNQVELRNDNLKRDNASLLQRWLDRMNDEAERMNEGNRFLQEVDQRRTPREEWGEGKGVGRETWPGKSSASSLSQLSTISSNACSFESRSSSLCRTTLCQPA